MSAELGGDLRPIGNNVEGRLTSLIEEATAGIGPDDHCEAACFGLRGSRANFLKHLVLPVGARIDGVTDAGTAELESVADAGGDRLVFDRPEAVALLALRINGISPAY